MALAAVLAQAAVVRYNYLGDGTALFRHGIEFPPPPALLAQHPLFIFPAGYGYDGQFYHFMAHDPFLRGDSWRYMDDPRLRYRRILGPMAAWLLSLGRSRFVDAAYDVVLAGAVFLGAWAFAAVARMRGRSAAWGAGFLLIPATVISLDRMTPDVAVAALTAVLAVAIEAGRRWLAYGVVALAPLVRETGWLLLAGYAASLALKRDWRRAGLVLLAGLPALAWYAYVHQVVPGQPYPLLMLPMSGIWSAVLHPPPVPPARASDVGGLHGLWRSMATPVTRFCGVVALSGIVLAFGWGVALFRRDPAGAIPIVALLFSLMGVLVQRPDHWYSVHDFGRVYSPLLAILAIRSLHARTPWPLLPVTLLWPRLVLEMSGEIVGVVRGIL